jgi:hypothetical protein
MRKKDKETFFIYLAFLLGALIGSAWGYYKYICLLDSSCTYLSQEPIKSERRGTYAGKEKN